MLKIVIDRNEIANDQEARGNQVGQCDLENVLLRSLHEHGLSGKKLLVCKCGKQESIINNDYDIIVFSAGVDCEITLSLNRPTVLIQEAGLRNKIMAAGPQASNSVFIATMGVDNSCVGVGMSVRGKVVDEQGSQCLLSEFNTFSLITVNG